MTQDELKELLNYSPDTGQFTWRKRTGGTATTGRPAGHITPRGYVFIDVRRKKYTGHRLAWFYVYGEWPPEELDHINGDKSDNRIANLRLASRNQNQWNAKLKSNNKSGFRGVHWQRSTKNWTAIIRKNGKANYLGKFDDPRDAARAYDNAAIKLHGEYARTNASMGLL